MRIQDAMTDGQSDHPIAKDQRQEQAQQREDHHFRDPDTSHEGTLAPLVCSGWRSFVRMRVAQALGLPR